MSDKNVTNTTVESAAVEEPTVAVEDTVEEKNESTKEVSKPTKAGRPKKVKESKVEETEEKTVKPLADSDEIAIESLIPNVSYLDSKTGDLYEWDEVGHIEYLTFETLKNMWRNHKGYFRNMWLKPNDDRIVKRFGLTKTFEKFEFLMDESNYTKGNIKLICDTISDTPNGLKRAICNRVKYLVVNGEVTDASVIKALEKHLNIELMAFL